MISSRALARSACTLLSTSNCHSLSVVRQISTNLTHIQRVRRGPIGFRNLSVFGRKGLHTSVVLSQEASGDDDPKVIPNEEWARRLTPEQYFCTREGGTEPPFSGQYLNHKAEGHYTCVCCSTELFSSKCKYDSGSGWPSFFAALDDSSNSSAVIRRKDISHGMVRNEIICKNCNAHLGHVFEDGPEPTGERFCVNSVALKFLPKKLS